MNNDPQTLNNNHTADTDPYNTPPPPNKKINTYTPLIMALIMVVGIQIGYKLQQSMQYKNTILLDNNYISVTNPRSSSVSQLNEVLGYIGANYVDTINSKKLIENTIENTLQELDPHSVYLSAEELKEANESLEGKFDGIGIEFSILNDTITVTAPLIGGPAEKLGIQTGDKIVKINDTLVANKKIANKDVFKKLRGKSGTTVKVGIQRPTVPDILDFTITRDAIPLYSIDVSYMMNSEVGFIKINRFSAETYTEFVNALQKLQAQGMQKLILDLRQNPGGYLNAATEIADEFLERGNLLVYTEGVHSKRHDYKDLRPGMFENGKLIVLLDEGSASASEILAGAVQDWDRGTIIGRRSFGKGLVQEQYSLTNGGAMRLTIARYYTPSGRCIQKSYDKGHEAYQDELLQRYKNGELENPDSIHLKDTTAFFTLKKHRKVYSGGGIMPDIFVPLDTTKNEPFTNKIRSIVSNFAYQYFVKNQSTIKNLKDFKTFNNQFVITPQIMEQFKTYAQKEIKGKWSDSLFERDKIEWQTYIKAYIARQLFRYEGYYQVVRPLDKTLEKAYIEIQK